MNTNAVKRTGAEKNDAAAPEGQSYSATAVSETVCLIYPGGKLRRRMFSQDFTCGFSAAALSRATQQITQLTHTTRTLIDINAYSWKPSVEHV